MGPLCRSYRASAALRFSWYLNWLAPQWQAVVLGDYEAVLPVFDRKKYGFNFTTRPFGTQSTGPYSKIPLTSELVKTLVNKAVEHFKYGEFFLALQHLSLRAGV